jgi:hypothetical protein
MCPLTDLLHLLTRTLVGKLQERYGIARDEAERQVTEFERTHERV